MNDTEIKIAVAEKLGVMKWSHALPHKCIHCDVPDYPNDLNAMHEAWLTLKGDDCGIFIRHLCCVIMGDKEPREDWLKNPLSSLRMSVNATARQRAEAFLRVFGLWRD